MEIGKNNKPKEKIRAGRISLAKWENTNPQGEVFTCFSLCKTLLRRDEDNPSRFEGQVFSLNGLTKDDLEAVKEVIAEMEEKVEVEGWSQ